MKKKLSKEIKIRKVRVKDTVSIAGLLKELGYSSSSSFAKNKILKLTKSEIDTVLVAEADGKVIGVGHLHIAELFHEPGKLGRIMAIVVNKKYRQTGVGLKLMTSLESIARKTGSSKMEVTSAAKRDDAHKFYLGLGYFEKPKRFIKMLDK